MTVSTDYENLGRLSFVQRPILLEFYRGVDIVSWQGKIERQLQKYVDEAVESRNHVYADKLREFLKTWRAHQLTGSINVETINALETATAQVAVDPWKYQDYFGNLRDQLRRLKASVEELPMNDVVPPEERGPGAGAPPDDFGPESGEGTADLGANAAAGALVGEAPSGNAPPP